MDYTIEFDAPAEKIYQDFTSREYWQTLMDSYRFLTPQAPFRATLVYSNYLYTIAGEILSSASGMPRLV